MGSYTSNASAFIKEFQYITQTYSLNFHDVHMILTNNLLPEEHRWVWEETKTHADKIHQIDGTYPIGLIASVQYLTKFLDGIIILQLVFYPEIDL